MQCATVRTAIVDRELGLLGATEAAHLDLHLSGCRACATVARTETRLTAGLLSLREELPYDVNVTPEVALRVADLPPIDRDEVPAWQLGWAAAAAVVGAVALLGALWSLRPELGQLASDARVVVVGLGDVLLRFLGTAVGLLAVPLRFVGRVVESVAAVAPAWSTIGPAAIGILAVGYAAMAVTITLFVGRDLRQSAPWTREDR